MARKGGFPGGAMPGNMNNMMKQVQKMQKEIKDQDVEILQSLEKYYEIIFSQISKNLKDE